jgi:hypothetical protein
MLKFIVVGTGRCGTAYIAHVLNHVGIFCGHEWVYTTSPGELPVGIIGDSSAQAAPFAASFPGLVLHQTRHPLKVIGSFLRFGLFDDYRRCGEGGEFIARHFQFTGQPLADAMRYYVEWNLLCERVGGYQRYRLEDMDSRLLCQLGEWIGVPLGKERAEEALARVPSNCNTRGEAPSLSWGDLPAGSSKDRLIEMADRYGYEAA